MAPIENTWDETKQVPEDETYQLACMRVKSVRVILEGLRGLLDRMEPFIKIWENQGKQDSPFIQEIENVRSIVSWMNAHLKDKNNYEYIYQTLSHKIVRYLKAGLLYKQLLVEDEINKIRQENSSMPDAFFEELEEQIFKLKEEAEEGFFKNTKPADIFLSILLPNKKNIVQTEKTCLLLDNIPIIDKELSDRCSSLLALADSKIESINQYDDVLRSAITVLESRIKDKTGLNDYGDALIGKAFNKDKPILKVSSNENVQNGVIFLFKGYIAVIRNDLAHNVVPLTRERTVQLLGFVDYLLSIVEGAEKV